MRILMFLCEKIDVFFYSADHLPHGSFSQMHFNGRNQPLRSEGVLRDLLIWHREKLPD